MTIRDLFNLYPETKQNIVIVEKQIIKPRSFFFEFVRVLLVLVIVTAITWGITGAQTDEGQSAPESTSEQTSEAPAEAPQEEAQEVPAEEQTPETPTDSPEEQTIETPNAPTNSVDTPTEEPTTPPDSTPTSGGSSGSSSNTPDQEPSTDSDEGGILTNIIETITDIVSDTLNTVSDLLTATSTEPTLEEEITASSTAPILFAEQDTETGKLVTVSSPDEDPDNPYTNVLASTTIPEIYKVGEEDKIQIKWTNNGDQEMSFNTYDTDNNGYLDLVEWTIPHLSTQIFEIIFISKAFHLDTNQTILADIYDTVKEQDGNFATLSDGQYIRATFEQILNNTKDITIYAKSSQTNADLTQTNSDRNPASLEVFPLYDDGNGNLIQGSSIATFGEITEEGTYRVLLSNLTEPTDKFDIQVSGDIEVDLVIDPIVLPLFTAETDGPIDDGATFGTTSPGTIGVHFPGPTDDVDVAGYNLTASGAVTVDEITDSIGGGSLTIDADLTATTITDVSIVVTGTSLITGDIVYSLSGNAIYNGGTITDISGTIINSGVGYGINNDISGIITDISGSITNSGGSIGLYNNGGNIEDLSGVFIDTGGVDSQLIFNSSGIINNISGIINNDGTGVGITNYDSITNISATITNSSTGYGVFNSGTITINDTFIVTNTGGGIAIDNGGTIDGSGTIIGDFTNQSILDLSGGLTIQGTLSNSGTVTPASSCGGGKALGSIWDGSITRAMCEVPLTTTVDRCGVITSPGTYTLNTNLSNTGSSCIKVDTGVTGVIIDGASTYSIDNSVNVNSGIFINSGAEVTIQNITITNSGQYVGIENYGTITDMSGTVNNSGASGIYNWGNISDISGTVENSGSGYGINNAGGTISLISGTIDIQNSGYGIYNTNSGTISNISGSITNSGGGWAICNDVGTIDVISSNINHSGAYGIYNQGTINTISGELTDNSQTIISNSSSGTIGNISGTVNANTRIDDRSIENGGIITTISGTINNTGPGSAISIFSGSSINSIADTAIFSNTGGGYGIRFYNDGSNVNTTLIGSILGLGVEIDLSGNNVYVGGDWNVSALTGANSSGALYLSYDLTASSQISNIPLIVEGSGITIDADIDFTLPYGAMYNYAIKVNNGATLTDYIGTMNKTGYYGIYNEGSIDNISGTINSSSENAGNSGATGIYNSGSIDTISGTFNHLANDGIGIDNYGIITTISGTTTNSGYYGILNESGATINDISGTTTNSGSTGIYNLNGGTITDISGSVTNTGYAGIYNEGTITDISGTITNNGNGGLGGYGIYNLGTIITISAAIYNNSGVDAGDDGVGIYNNGTINNLLGTVEDTANGWGVLNDSLGFIDEASADFQNSLTAWSIENRGLINLISGQFINSNGGTSIVNGSSLTGTIGNISSTIVSYDGQAVQNQSINPGVEDILGISGTIYNFSGSSYTGLETVPISGSLINLPVASGYIWANTLNDHDWYNAGNWLGGVVPATTTDNIILASDMVLSENIANPIYFAKDGIILDGNGFEVADSIYSVNGNNDLDSDSYSTKGFDINLIDVTVTGNLTSGNGGTGVFGNGNPSPGGNITITNAEVQGSVTSGSGGDGWSSVGEGNGGAIIITDSTVGGDIFSGGGGFIDSTGTGGSGGAITISNSTFGDITAGNGGLSPEYGGNGGAISITDTDLDLSSKIINGGVSGSGSTIGLNSTLTITYNSLTTDTSTYFYDIDTLTINGTPYVYNDGGAPNLCTNGVTRGDPGCAWNGVFNPLIFYYNNAMGDGDWNNYLNWWHDVNFTVQAESTEIPPTLLNQVIIYGEISTSTDAVADTIVFNGTSTSDIDITVFRNATFNDSSSNSGTITLSGSATFNDSSSNTGSITAATSTFYGDNTSASLGGIGTIISNYIQRIYESSATTIRDFTTEGGTNAWTIISTGVNTIVDLSGAIYDLATNVFKGLLGGSFVENESIVTDPGFIVWTPRDSNRSWQSITSSSDGTKLAVVLIDGQIYTSTDSGVTWTPRDSNRSWQSITSSSDGTKLAAVVTGGQIYTSTDSGVTWTPRDSNRNWRSITSSSDGTKLAAVVGSGQIYTSTDSGVTWTARDSNRTWQSITSSSDGTKLAAVVTGGQIYTSTDSGLTWIARESNRSWISITSSTDGTKLAAVVASAGQIYTSTDSGVTWTPRDSNRNWRSITSSSDGTKLASVEYGGQIYTSTDSGVTWSPKDSNRDWRGITSNAAGDKLAAVVYGGKIYTSTFEEGGTGIDVVPTVIITSPIPKTTGDTTKWAPDIDWGTAVQCQYSYDEDYATIYTLDCAEDGADLPRPTAAEHTLYIRATDAHGGLTEKSVNYIYDNSVATYTMCGADLLDENRPYYYLTEDVTGPCTITASQATTILKGNLVSTSTGYTVTGNIVSNGKNINLQNISVTGTVDSNGGNIIASTATINDEIISNGGNITLSSSISATSTSQGGDITLTSATTTALVSTATSTGATAGSVTINSSTIGSITANGVSGTNGGNGGIITIATSTTGILYANGANGTTDGGNGGNITITNSYATPVGAGIFSNGGNSTSCGDGGDAGLVSLTSSTYGTITANGGSAVSCGSSGQSRSVGNGITIQGSYTAPGSGSSGGESGGGNTGGGSSTGGTLRNLIKNIVNPLDFTPLTPFTPFSPSFNPTTIGDTLIPDPFQNFRAPGLINLIQLPINFLTNISKFLFAPLPDNFKQALLSSPQLGSYLASVGVSKEQDMAMLQANPVPLDAPLSDGATPPGLFIIRSGQTTLTSYATYDASLGGLAQLVKTAPTQSLSLSLIPQSEGQVTALYLGQTITFTKGSLFASTQIQTPSQGGRYILKSASSPIPLLIEVIAPIQPETPAKKPWGIFNFLWKLFQ